MLLDVLVMLFVVASSNVPFSMSWAAIVVVTAVPQLSRLLLIDRKL